MEAKTWDLGPEAAQPRQLRPSKTGDPPNMEPLLRRHLSKTRTTSSPTTTLCAERLRNAKHPSRKRFHISCLSVRPAISQPLLAP
ncbi:hypothetical protein VTJ04DRAFT_824 [Mycothermus thermophilus]|uniref:uncharacterized protein n=1 Tax=Humicola insolens TaxID=85995 RepID=UPI003742B9F6